MDEALFFFLEGTLEIPCMRCFNNHINSSNELGFMGIFGSEQEVKDYIGEGFPVVQEISQEQINQLISEGVKVCIPR